MFRDYESLVLEAYLQKKSDSKSPLSLRMPSPARLREECERVCSERFQRKDEPVIREFFGKSGDQKACLEAIRNCNIDWFRPLARYMRTGGIFSPEPKNIELLAWLIDFKDRPFILGKRYPPATTIGSPITLILSEEDYPDAPLVEKQEAQPIDQETVYDEKTPIQSRASVLAEAESVVSILPPWRYWNALAASLLMLVGGIVGFQTWDKKEKAMLSTGNGGCMYWADDHYQPIPCNQKVPNTLVVALDTLLVKNFRRITQPDTITKRAIGAVWYLKFNKKLEYFTSAGEHPVLIGRRLNPITGYIIDKYIKTGMVLNE
jgi:hypothetical protein